MKEADPRGQPGTLRPSLPAVADAPRPACAQLKFIEEWKGKGAEDVDSQVYLTLTLTLTLT